MLNVFLCGRKYFGHLVLKMLLEERGVNVLGVCTKSDDRTAITARNARLDYFVPSGQLRADTLPDNTDLIVSAHSYDFIGEKTLKKSKLGGVGYHPSLLPLHRGRDSVKWASRMGDRVNGGTVYWLSKRCDGGDIAAQDYLITRPGIPAKELWREHLQPMGVELLRRSVRDICNKKIVRIPQDERLATWEPSLDAPPVFRPELPQLGCIEGYETVCRPDFDWKTISGG